MIHSWMETLRQCEESGHWPGYAQSVVDWDVPGDEDELIFGDEDEGSEAAQ